MTDSTSNGFDNSNLGKIVSVMVLVLLLAVVLIPICNSLASGGGEPGGENQNPVSDLRLTYTEDKIPMMFVNAYTENNELNVEIYDNEDDFDNRNPSYSITGITDDVIIFASDYISMLYQNGQIVTNYVDSSESAPFGEIGIMEGGIGFNPSHLIPYTFLYYPSQDGEYANFSSYQFDSGNMYSVASQYGMTFASKDGKFVGYSPYDVTTNLVKEDGNVVGVEYTAKVGDGTGTLPSDDGEDEPHQIPISH